MGTRFDSNIGREGSKGTRRGESQKGRIEELEEVLKEIQRKGREGKWAAERKVKKDLRDAK